MTLNIFKLIKDWRKKGQKAYRSGWNDDEGYAESTYVNASWNQFAMTQNQTEPEGIGNVKRSTKDEPPQDLRLTVKPVEVVKEIITEEPRMMLDGLDEQIKIVKRRIKVFKEQHISNLRDEEIALSFLQARVKYKKYKGLFRWDITTNQKINELISKYKVSKVNLSGYSRTIPMEALDEMEKFVNAFKKVRDDEPYMQLIIDYGGPEQRKDPILLAGSPFGNWFHILGAWDKEVAIVDDLVYKGK